MSLGQRSDLRSGIVRIDQLIDRQAEQAPTCIAVRHQQKSLTYGELGERADRLAHALIAAGVTRQTLVGISMSRSVDMVVAVLGILKAGGAFVPLDPAYPKARLALMLEDSRASVIVSERGVASQLPAHNATLLLLDELDLSRFPGTAPQVASMPSDLAYCVYTSGSTGRPKGVMIEHGSLLSFIAWTSSRFTADQLSCVLASSSLSFDVSYFEIFAPLAVGGSLYLVNTILDLLFEPPRAPIRTMSTVASALAELVRMRAIPQSVTTILQAGEYLPASLARDIYQTSNVHELINLCGGTEDTIYSVSYVVPKNVPEDPPIGKPFLDRYAYILDEDRQPVGVGQPGEIYYGGSGVARGYINRPELSAERFVPNPFGHSPTMYRSGDIAFWGEDGEMRYLRRNDQQVKIRGFRVELSEVEAIVREHPAIDQVVILARDVGAHKSLAAYAVQRHDTDERLDYDTFTRFAAQRLPEYMIPSTLVLLDAMPMGPSGKLDREALGRLERRRPEIGEEYLAPRNPFEEQITLFMADALALDRVGVLDNFFALGGQSLLATRFIANVAAAYPNESDWLDAAHGENALLAAFFADPTAVAVAGALNTAKLPLPGTTQTVSALRLIQEGEPCNTPFFLLHGVLEGEAFYAWNLAQGVGHEIPFYTIAPHGFDHAPVPETIAEMADDYLAVIRRTQPHGPYRLGGYCNGGHVALEIARRLRAAGEEVDGLVLIAASARNTRFAKLYEHIERFGKVFGLHEATRREIFLRIRGRLLLLKRGRHWREDPLGALRRLMQRTVTDDDAAVASVLGRRNPREVNRQRILKFLRAIDAYVPAPYDGPVRVLWGLDDPHAEPDDPYNGWDHIASNLDYRHVAGGHVFLEDRPELVVEHLISIVQPRS